MDNLFYSTRQRLLCEVDAEKEYFCVSDLITQMQNKSKELAAIVNTDVSRVKTTLLTKGRYADCRMYYIENVTCPNSAYVIPDNMLLHEWIHMSFQDFWMLIVM